jgi:hypothetical protein
MKKFLFKLLAAIAFIVASVYGGWNIACLIMLVPYNMPYFLDIFLRFCLSILRADYLANADDLPIVALLLFWIVSTPLVGVLIFLCGKAIRRHYRARKVRRESPVK